VIRLYFLSLADQSPLLVVFLGTLNKQLFICKYTPSGVPIGGQGGCYNLVPVFEWIRRCIISIFLVFFIAFLPLFLQGMTLLRLLRHSDLYLRANGKRNWSCSHPLGQALLVSVTDIRGFLHSDLHSFDLEQLDLWRSSIHCHRTRFRNCSRAIQ
jgi:hypothetical protein